MKKAKIMLSVIAVLAIVGGALAFKAKKFTPGPVFCAEIKNGATTCTAQAPQVLYTTANNGNLTTTVPCPLAPQAANTSVYCTTTNTNVTNVAQTVWEIIE